MNLIELSIRNREKFGAYDRLVFGERIFSNIEMEQGAARLAAHLEAIGVKPGDRVVTMMPNSPEILMAYLAIFQIGAVVVPLMYILQAQEAAYILANCEPVAVLTSAALGPKAVEAVRLSGVASVRAVLVNEEEAPPGTVSLAGVWANGLASSGFVPRTDDDLAVMIYTSGTTGNPKGVMLTHGNLIANSECARQRAENEGTSPNGEAHLAVLPLAHSYGLLTMGNGFQFKTTVVLLPAFKPEAVLGAIQRWRVRQTALVPTMVTMLLHHPGAEQYDTSSLEKVRCGSAPIPVETLRAFEKKFGCTIYEGYGLTETGGILSAHPQNKPTRVGSVGVPMEHVTVRIHDDEGRELPTGEWGEIVARGPNVMKGYYKMPEATAEAMRGGWLRTGDIGHFDADGYLHIVGRKKDLIIRGGFNIVPSDIEEVLARHPAVIEAAVIGIPDPRLGEEVKACIVLAPGRSATEEEIMAFCRDQISHNKAPRHVEFMAALPKNAMGKVLKKELRRLAGA